MAQITARLLSIRSRNAHGPKGSEVRIFSAMEIPYAPTNEAWVLPDSYYAELERVA
jgi:hypothetical protein